MNGLDAVQAAADFPVVAPDTLVGCRARTSASSGRRRQRWPCSTARASARSRVVERRPARAGQRPPRFPACRRRRDGARARDAARHDPRVAARRRHASSRRSVRRPWPRPPPRHSSERRAARRGARPRQALRRARRRRPRRPDRRARRRLRLPRPERRRQDDLAADAARADPARPKARAELFGRDPLVDGARALDGVAGFVEGAALLPVPHRAPATSNCWPTTTAASRAHGSTRCWSSSSCATGPSDRVGGFSHGMRQRLGIAGVAPAQARSCSCSTSRRPGSTRPACATCARSSAARRRGHHDPALEPSALRGRGALQSRRDHPHAAAIIYEGCSRDLLATAATRLPRCAAPTPSARGLVCSRSAGSQTSRVDGGELRFAADEEAVAALSVALGQARHRRSPRSCRRRRASRSSSSA